MCNWRKTVYILHIAHHFNITIIFVEQRKNMKKTNEKRSYNNGKNVVSFVFFCFCVDSDSLRFFAVQPLHCWCCSSFCLFIGSITLHFLLSHHSITREIPSIGSSVFCYSVISFSVCYCFSFSLLRSFAVSLHYFVLSIVVCVCSNEDRNQTTANS